MASKCRLAVECILQIVQDGNIHEYHEFMEKAIKCKVIDSFEDKAVSNALTWLKKNNPDFIQVKKGEYLLRTANIKNIDVDFSLDTFDDVVSRLLIYIRELSGFNWRRCSEAEFKEARRKLDVLNKLEDSIKQIQ